MLGASLGLLGCLSPHLMEATWSLHELNTWVCNPAPLS